MRAGALRHRIEIQVLTTTRNTFNEEVPEWKSQAFRWVELLPIKGTESLQQGLYRAQTDYKMRMRFYDGLNPKTNRIKFRSKLFNITSVLNVAERDREMVVECNERKDSADPA